MSLGRTDQPHSDRNFFIPNKLGQYSVLWLLRDTVQYYTILYRSDSLNNDLEIRRFKVVASCHLAAPSVRLWCAAELWIGGLECSIHQTFRRRETRTLYIRFRYISDAPKQCRSDFRSDSLNNDLEIRRFKVVASHSPSYYYVRVSAENPVCGAHWFLQPASNEQLQVPTMCTPEPLPFDHNS